MEIAKDITILAPPALVSVEFSRGTCALALTSAPFGMMPPGINCWVLLADWLPTSASVGMYITFIARQSADGSPPICEVHSVGAVIDMRGNLDAGGATVPVALGRWLFYKGYLTRHSPDRTERGDRWARLVGGDLPARDLERSGTADAAERSSVAAIARLNEETWPPAPWPDLPS